MHYRYILDLIMHSLAICSGLCILFTLTIRSYGLYCLSCTDGVSPRHCHYVMKCSEGEVCITKSHLSKNGLVVFDTGCLSIEKCHPRQINVSDSHQLQQAVDQRTICLECCSSDLCNQKGCGQIGYPSPRGPVCFNCPQVSNPTLCDKIEVCDKSQECYIQKEEEFGDIIYSSGCIRKHVRKVWKGKLSYIAFAFV